MTNKHGFDTILHLGLPNKPHVHGGLYCVTVVEATSAAPEPFPQIYYCVSSSACLLISADSGTQKAFKLASLDSAQTVSQPGLGVGVYSIAALVAHICMIACEHILHKCETVNRKRVLRLRGDNCLADPLRSWARNWPVANPREENRVKKLVRGLLA